MESEKKETCRNHRITVTQGMSGFFAVMIADYEDMNWMSDCVQTGIGRYAKQADAIAEGKEWAENEELPFEMPVLNDSIARQDAEAQIREIIPEINILRPES